MTTPEIPRAGTDRVYDAATTSGKVLTAIFELRDAEALYQARLRLKLTLSNNELVAVQLIERLDVRGIDARPIDVKTTLGVTSSATSIILRRLVERGFITRQLNPHDGRGQLLHLTALLRDAIESASGMSPLVALDTIDDLTERESRRVVVLLSTVTAIYDDGALSDDPAERSA